MLHFIKYNIIGIMNTLITLLVSYILFELLDWNLELSNFIGFVAGGCNSYLCNRIWNFKSHNDKKSEIIRFLVVFICAYGVNLAVLEGCVYLLKQPFCASFVNFVAKFMEKPDFIANIAANVVYVLVSFTMYKKWVFRSK